jgi:RNA polymerase sigma-70 factor (ECF subfamily)
MFSDPKFPGAPGQDANGSVARFGSATADGRSHLRTAWPTGPLARSGCGWRRPRHLPRTAQVALTLRVVCGLTTAQIAKAFLVPEFTVGQRITRAKRKISQAGIPYRIPSPDELGTRLTKVLAVIYLLCNEGYLSSGAEQVQSRDLLDDAEFLAALLYQLMPAEPEVIGLLALIRLHRARSAARFDPDGAIVQLPHQDRTRWDHQAIADAGRLIAHAAALKRPGPYQLQAAIVACHAEAARWEDTDWTQILVLYDILIHLAPSPVTRLHRAIATRYVQGSAARTVRSGQSRRRTERLPPLPRHPRATAARTRPYRPGSRRRPRALALTTNPAEQSLLRQRLTWN